MDLRMRKFAVLAALCTTGLLAACESQPIKDENSQFYSVPLGSRFTLNNEITIPPDNTSVFLQFGKTLASKEVDFYKPHCKFELFTISTEARVVKPDAFVVIRIVDQREDVSITLPTYAGLSMSYGDGPLHLTYSTAMYLESKIQPDVFRMDCKRWDDPAIGEYLSINEMRQALGDVFTLSLAE
jgi:hypothetical protein